MQETIAIVGGGRLGRALTGALRATGPFGRGHDGAGADVVLLCVPDGEISAAAAAIAPGPIVGHCSGATGLDVLAPHEAFSLHPLMTVTVAQPRRLLEPTPTLIPYTQIWWLPGAIPLMVSPYPWLLP